MVAPLKFAVLAALLLTTPAPAQDFLGPLEEFVETLRSPMPAPPETPRPAPEAIATPTAAAPPPVPRPRPPSLPETPPPPPADGPLPEVEPAPEAGVATEPARVYQAACPAVLSGLVRAEMAPPLSEARCGEQSPLVVTAVSSRGRMVPLSAPITTNCQMASALPGWVQTLDGYAEAMLGSELATVNTGTGYMCRNRNNAAAGFVSEHGFANAVDVTGFTLADGRSIAVTADWLPADAAEGRLLRLAHDAGCAAFTTALGPEANAEHADHLHLDLGCHGASCMARICE